MVVFEILISLLQIFSSIIFVCMFIGYLRGKERLRITVKKLFESNAIVSEMVDRAVATSEETKRTTEKFMGYVKGEFANMRKQKGK